MVGIGTSTRRCARWIAVAVLAGTPAIACGAGGDGDAEPAAGSGAAGSGGALCDDARLMFQHPVSDTDAEVSDTEAVGILKRLAGAADGDDAAMLEELGDFAERFESDPGSIDPADATQVTGLFADALAWSVRTCPPTTTIWGCASQSEFRAVGEAIGAPGEPSPSAGGSATPEEAAGSSDEVGLERVEVQRSDGAVRYAWVGDDGLAQRSVEVVESGGGWTNASTRSCN